MTRKRKIKRTRKPAKQSASAAHWAEYAARYKEHGGNCGDEVATRLKQFDADGLERLAKTNDVWKPSYEQLRKVNPGSYRMSISNRLRALDKIKWGHR
jgi:hypothetical protein